LCAVKFEVEQREIDFTKELVLAGKAVMIEQDRGSIAPLLILDLISDNKEEEGEKEEEAEEEEEEEEEEKENRQERHKNERALEVLACRCWRHRMRILA
jgi:ABC-type Zn2+ transport system substrate-binding protein/surface adhesin